MSFRRDIICSLYSMTAGVGLFFWLLLEFPEQIISLNPPENFLRIFVKFLGISIGTGMLLGFIATRLISSKWVVSLRRFVICSLCLMIVGVGLSIWRLLEFPEQIIPVSPPQSLAAMLLRCLGIWIAAGLFFGLAVELFFNLWRMQVLPKRRTLLVIGAPLAVYIGIYLVTTTVRLQG